MQMNISFASLPLESIILIVFVIALAALSVSAGKRLLLSYIFALYPTYLIVSNLPYAKTPTAVVNLLIILAVFFAIFAAVRTAVHGEYTYTFFKYVQAGILSLVATGTTLVMYAGLAATGIKLPTLLLSTAKLSLGYAPFTVWLILPLIVLFVVGRE